MLGVFWTAFLSSAYARNRLLCCPASCLAHWILFDGPSVPFPLPPLLPRLKKVVSMNKDEYEATAEADAELTEGEDGHMKQIAYGCLGITPTYQSHASASVHASYTILHMYSYFCMWDHSCNRTCGWCGWAASSLKHHIKSFALPCGDSWGFYIRSKSVLHHSVSIFNTQKKATYPPPLMC